MHQSNFELRNKKNLRMFFKQKYLKNWNIINMLYIFIFLKIILILFILFYFKLLSIVVYN